MPGIEDLTNIMMAGGRPDVPMPPSPQGAPMGPPQGPPMGGPPPQGPPPPDMMARNQGPPPPDMMADQIPMEEQAPEMSIEQDSMALAEAVVGRAQGDIQMAVTILDTAKAMLMQSAEQPQMANMGGPLYAAKGRALSDSDIDDTEVLKQMIMDDFRDEMAYGERDVSDADIESVKRFVNSSKFRDYQPEYEGLPEDYKSKMDDSWFGKLRKFIPDAYQVNEWLADKKGFPSISDIDADDLRQYKGNRALEREMGDKLAGRRQELRRALSDRDRTISEMISDEELRNEMRMLEREEPSAERASLLEEMRERATNYRSR